MDVVFHFRRSPTRLLRRSGIVSALATCVLSFSPSVWAQSPCAIVTRGATPTSADITAAINMALAPQTCVAQVEGNNKCTVITVQRVFNASQGQPCITYNTHAAKLSWTASTTSGVTYNVYRSTTTPVPLTTPYATTSGTTFTDTNANLTPGATYYYAVTAVLSGVQSTAVTAPAATIPSP
jgi:hypothetical protein